jgi:hypothetical protein
MSKIDNWITRRCPNVLEQDRTFESDFDSAVKNALPKRS